MFKDWLKYGETEVANSPRAAAYVRNGLKPTGAIIGDCSECEEDLAAATGHDGPYRTPALDEAPWYTPEDPDTAAFAGVQVVEVTGLSGSTIVTSVEEKTGDGGVVGSRRAASRTIQVTADVIGSTPESMEVGLEWLSGVLHPPCAEGAGCSGDTLHLFSTCPVACEGVTDPDAGFVTTRYDETANFSGSSVSGTQPMTNHLTNSSFEDGTGSTLTEWVADPNWIYNTGTLASVVPPSGVGVVSRTKVGRLTVGATVANPSTMRQTVSGLTIGRTYTLSGWIYVPAATEGRWALNWFSEFFGTGDYITRRDEWVYAQHVFVATKTTHEVGWTTTDNDVAPATAGGVVYFDGMMLVEGSGGGGTGFSGASNEGWTTSDGYGIFTAPILSVSPTGGNPGGYLNLAWKAALDAGSTRHAAYGLVAQTVPGEVYTITFDVYVPTGSPDVQPHVLFQNDFTGETITAKNTWVPVSITVAATENFMRVGVQHFTASPGAGKSARIDNFRAWRSVGPLEKGHFDGATPDSDYSNVGAGATQTTTGTMTLEAGVADGPYVWTRATHTSTSAVRNTIPAASLFNGRTYWASYVVKNPTLAPVDVTVNFAHSGDATYTLAPGESRRLYGRGVAANYANAADRFSDLILPGSSSEVLFRDFRLEAAYPATYSWASTAETSKSVREPLGGLLFNPDSPASLLTASSQPAICDDVTVEWLVSSASGSAVRVYPMITAPDGSVVHGNIETVGPEAPGMVSVSAGSSPGFPNDWTPVLRTLPEGWTPGAAPIPNPYLPAGALYNPEGLVPFWDALLDRETIMVNVAMLGDSITEGVGAPTWDQRPVIALQSRLRTAFPISGTQGPGYVAAYTWSGQIAPGLSVLAGSIRPYDQWQDANRYGLGSKAVTLLSTDHLRYDFTGTRVKVWYGWSSVAFATANGQVRIDGGAWQTMTSDAEDGSGQFWESPLLAPGPHYVEVRGTTTNVPFVLEGFEAFGSEQDHSAGVHVYDSAHSSYFSSQFTGSSVGNGSRMWQVLDKIQPVLFYVNIGVNDHAWDLTPAQTKANVEAIIARCAAAAGGKPYSVLLVVNYTPISSNPSFAANWANIRTALLSLAGGVVTVLDMNTMWPTLGPGQPQGVMLETDYPLHPNGTGHQLQVDNISNALIHGWETGEDMIGVSTDPGEPVLVHALDVTHRPILTVEECISPYRRTFNGVVTVAGPTVVEQRTLGDTTDGSTVARVEWTWVATEPHAWHDPLPILAGVDGKGSAVAYRADGVPVTDAATVTAGSTSCSRPAPTLVTCADNVLCSPAAMPPQPPALLDDCVMDLAGSTYTRRRFEIPEDLSPRGVGRLFWTFANDGKPKFGVRVRLWRDMDPAFDPEPECGFTEEFTIEYLGPNQILYIDGPGNDVYVYCGEDEFQNPIYADARRNLRGSYGGPFAVSEVGCSHGYVVAVDIPDTYTDAGLSGETVGTSQGNLTWGFDLVRRA